MSPPGHPWVSTKKFQPNRSSRLAGYAQLIYSNVLFSYIEFCTKYSRERDICETFFTHLDFIQIILASINFREKKIGGKICFFWLIWGPTKIKPNCFSRFGVFKILLLNLDGEYSKEIWSRPRYNDCRYSEVQGLQVKSLFWIFNKKTISCKKK